MKILEALERRYDEAASERNGTLIRSDIILSLRKLYDATDDPDIATTARKLTDAEEDPKYRAKYANPWEDVDSFSSS